MLSEHLLPLALSVPVFVVSVVLTRATLGYSRRWRLMDVPGDRRSHRLPTPRGGGLGFVLTCLMVAAGAWIVLPAERPWVSGIGIALAGVGAIGWLDDHRSLPIWPRLLVHGLSAALIVVSLYGIPASPAQFGLGIISALALVVLTNLWNFMDGIDGLAGSQALIVATAVAVLAAIAGAPALVGAGVLTASAVAGFLPFNLPRARIFMGDVGSGSLGLLVGVLLLWAIEQQALDGWLAAVLVSGFLVDGGLTLFGRMLRRERWWQPHTDHLYQWAVRAGFSHLRVTAVFAGWTVASAGVVMMVATREPDLSGPVAVTLASGSALIWLVARKQLQRTAKEGIRE